jgi:hypothetical protein
MQEVAPQSPHRQLCPRSFFARQGKEALRPVIRRSPILTFLNTPHQASLWSDGIERRIGYALQVPAAGGLLIDIVIDHYGRKNLSLSTGADPFGI